MGNDRTPPRSFVIPSDALPPPSTDRSANCVGTRPGRRLPDTPCPDGPVRSRQAAVRARSDQQSDRHQPDR